MEENLSAHDVAMNKKKSIHGYCMYDWGKSAFETSVTVAILPAWFAYLFLEANGLTGTVIGVEMTSDAAWSLAVALGTMAVAIVSPSIGVIADRKKIKMKALKWMTWLGAGSVFLLSFAPLFGTTYSWMWIFIMFLMANIGLNAAGVFYNALLPYQGEHYEMDSISNKAYAYGYLGGGLLLVFHLGLILGVTGDWVVPFCIASSGVWWFGFSWYTFAYVAEPEIENEVEDLTLKDATKLGVSEVWNTLKEWKNFRTLFIYMLAYFLFIDGINSVTALAGAFGIAVLGLTMTDLIMTIVVIQFVAFPAAFFFTWLAERWSTKKALTFSLVMWCVMIVGAMSFAPLSLEEHEEYDYQAEWDDESYVITVRNLELVGMGDEDQDFKDDWEHILPFCDDCKNNHFEEDTNGSADLENMTAFLTANEDTRYSVSVIGGTLSNSTMVGIDHPTNLGDGKLDFIPVTVREHVWSPLGMTVFWQWLILGCLAGVLMGGSQGLARSLFGQMVPETRSTEFFGFFGFFGKVSAFFGPAVYTILSVTFDSRVAIASLAMFIIAGTVMMRWVDVEDGIAVATAEDERNRGITLSEE
ncbi:MAG: MFS transporter [Candidatus Thalassarchaeaceae archaeon]|jgi:UMF1 family MFS transporter|nr:MFS transporter [Candidatus Thalassarchaeaceae archaeon]